MCFLVQERHSTRVLPHNLASLWLLQISEQMAVISGNVISITALGSWTDPTIDMVHVGCRTINSPGLVLLINGSYFVWRIKQFQNKQTVG